MKRLLAYLFIVMGLGLMVNNYVFADKRTNCDWDDENCNWRVYKSLGPEHSKVWGRILSGKYEGDFWFSAEKEKSLEKVLEFFYNTPECKHGCKVTYIGNEKISTSKQLEIAKIYMSPSLVEKYLPKPKTVAKKEPTQKQQVAKNKIDFICISQNKDNDKEWVKHEDDEYISQVFYKKNLFNLQKNKNCAHKIIPSNPLHKKAFDAINSKNFGKKILADSSWGPTKRFKKSEFYKLWDGDKKLIAKKEKKKEPTQTQQAAKLEEEQDIINTLGKYTGDYYFFAYNTKGEKFWGSTRRESKDLQLGETTSSKGYICNLRSE